jgi:uncharacterized membrane protein
MTTEIQRESKLDWMLVGWWLAVVCAVIGLADSIYLTWLKISCELAVCGGIGDCESVNVSIYSQINGIPIALLGAGAYFVMLLFLFLESRDDFIGDWSPMIVFGLSLTGTLYSIYLTYIEIAVLKAICPYCVLSAVAVLIIFVISIARLRRSDTH